MRSKDRSPSHRNRAPEGSRGSPFENLLFTAIFSAGTLLLAIRGVAQQTPTALALEQRFKQLDKNGDGKITTDEVRNRHSSSSAIGMATA